MKLLFTFYDKASSIHSNPMAFPSEAVARRVFQDVLTSGQSDMSKYPDDFELYHVGTFDELEGFVVACKPVFIVSAKAVLDMIEIRKANLGDKNV